MLPRGETKILGGILFVVVGRKIPPGKNKCISVAGKKNKGSHGGNIQIKIYQSFFRLTRWWWWGRKFLSGGETRQLEVHPVGVKEIDRSALSPRPLNKSSTLRAEHPRPRTAETDAAPSTEY